MFKNVRTAISKCKQVLNWKGDESKLTPSQYFNAVKERKNTIDDEGLQKVYDNCMDLINKYSVTGQEKSIDKLMFHLECIEKERELVKMGLNTFVYRDDIERYIDNIASDVVKIIELENYEREIPDEIIDVIYTVKEKNLFDRLYVVFTDYTGKIEKKVAKERRDRDPILFGAFVNSSHSCIIDRFYFLGDWEDEFCHLTLDKMVNETRKKTGENIERKFSTPEDVKEYRKQIAQLKRDGSKFYVTSSIENSVTSIRVNND